MRISMKITDEIRDRVFKEWFKEFWDEDLDLYKGHHKFQLEAFKAAFDILLPIIEKQNQALEFYADESNLSYGGYYDTVVTSLEETAVETLAFVEQEIKKMGYL